ncbi:patatin-like phospholipase family protein [Paenibacillus sp. NPDC058071]|uniref:patatin-like phospholipase family protein n=1 Tax=Paenibacillus sp. NPDC058071 TaxID=3346326 RepID=UPI0036DCB0F8
MIIDAVFEGGGVKGISLTGAVRGAEVAGIKFGQVAGTSIGAIIAALLAAGYDGLQMRHIVANTPFSTFLKRSFLFNVKVIGPAARLFIRKGLYSGEALEYWIEGLLAKRGIKTFGDLPPGKLRIVASDITNGRLLVLPDDYPMYGIDPRKAGVARAVRMSASIPFFFDPVILRYSDQASICLEVPQKDAGKKLHSAYIVDGGLLSNFPLWIFDKEKGAGKAPVVGFQMVGRNENEPRHIRGPLSMFQAMFETMLQAHDERYLHDDVRDRTVKIPTLGVRTTDFHLSKAMSEQLYLSGYRAAETFFEGFKCP